MEEKDIEIIKIEWIDKKNKKVRITFDFLKIDIKLSHLKNIIDVFLKQKENFKVYNKKEDRNEDRKWIREKLKQAHKRIKKERAEQELSLNFKHQFPIRRGYVEKDLTDFVGFLYGGEFKKVFAELQN